MGCGHQGRIALDERRELHPLEHVAPHVDAGRDLGEREALPGQAEHRALGDVDDLLPAPQRLAAPKR